MRNKVESCIRVTTDSQIKFEENKRKVIFLNPQRTSYKCVVVDGCTIKDGIKCDKLLLSSDEHEEYYVELKGTDVMHAIGETMLVLFYNNEMIIGSGSASTRLTGGRMTLVSSEPASSQRA